MNTPNKRRSLLKNLGIGFLSLFLVKNLSAENVETTSCAGTCPGYDDCQGFVPPCANCNDPNVWKPIAQKRLNTSFDNFWTITRLKFSNFFKSRD